MNLLSSLWSVIVVLKNKCAHNYPQTSLWAISLGKNQISRFRSTQTTPKSDILLISSKPESVCETEVFHCHLHNFHSNSKKHFRSRSLVVFVCGLSLSLSDISPSKRMSSYGGGNGFYYGNHYVDLCLNPQSLNVTSSPVIIKCEDVPRSEPLIKREELVKVSQVKCESEAAVIKEEIDTNEQGDDPSEHNGPEVDIMINNVVSSFNVRCHLNLRQIALNGVNVEYRRENGVSSFMTIIYIFIKYEYLCFNYLEMHFPNLHLYILCYVHICIIINITVIYFISIVIPVAPVTCNES